MGALSITGIKPGSTSLKLTAGKITKTVPITVLSRNLLAYGPASGNGLTVTVAQDGSLDFSSGTESVPLNKGVRWKFDVPEGIVGVPLVAPHWGAWIEIGRMRSSIVSATPSHPTGVRGLK